MKIVTYNVNGIRASVKLGLIEWLKNFDADIYCIQEVRCTEKLTHNLIFETETQLSLFDNIQTQQLSNYFAFYNCGSKPGYAGTMILSKIKPNKIIFDMEDYWSDDEGRTITMFFNKLAIVNAYIPNGNSRLDFKMDYLDALTKYISKLKEQYSVICVGDFNIAHNEIDLTHPNECKNKSVFLPKEREAFRKILNLGMIDSFRKLNPTQVCYSWRSYKSRYDTTYNAWKYRIDYVLTSDDLLKNLTKCNIYDLPYSDHCPVALELDI